MTTGQVLAAAATITAACVVLAVGVIVWAVRSQNRFNIRVEAYEYGWSEGVLDALKKHGPGTDQPEERLLWAASVEQTEPNPYGEVAS